jgi:alcohol dehydrogenase
MPDLFFHIPQQVIFGADTVNRIGALVSPFGKRALIVTESILYEQGTIERIQELLSRKKIESIVYDEVVPNSTSISVEEGVKLCRGAHVEVVIGLGSIRTLSTAKCIAMTAKGAQSIDDLLSGGKAEGEAHPYFEILTTCRNPFMLADEYLMVDARDRTARIGRTQKDITKGVILDPKLCFSLPAKYTATTMMDTMLSAVEGYLSVRSNILSDTLFCRAIEIIKSSIMEAVKDLNVLKHRSKASMAGLLTSLGLTTSKTGLGTSLSYAINGRLMVPKSWISSILIPYILEFNASTATEKIAHIGKIFGTESGDLSTVDAADQAIETIRSLIASLEMPTRLRDFDLELDDLLDSVEVAHSFDMMNHLPRTVSTEELYDIVKSAY